MPHGPGLGVPLAQVRAGVGDTQERAGQARGGAGVPFDERLRIAVDQAFQADVAARVKSLEKWARLRYPQADMRTLDLVEERGIDEWLLDKPDGDTLAFLLELTELRYGESPTLFATQYKREDWHERLGGGVHADAIMDRIVHNAVFLDTGGYNMRERMPLRPSASA